jgi:hypothetical protein
MNDIERKARELLAAEYKASGDLVQAMNIGKGGLSVMYAAEISAIAKALTPPEGYVLVPPPEGYVLAPEGPSQAMTGAGQLFGLTPNQACLVYQFMLAARPEVP